MLFKLIDVYITVFNVDFGVPFELIDVGLQFVGLGFAVRGLEHLLVGLREVVNFLISKHLQMILQHFALLFANRRRLSIVF